MVGVSPGGESWSSVKEKMYDHIRMGNSSSSPEGKGGGGGGEGGG